ncbi:hypothetical protein H072_900 [Dactylellina haptotyla CBS 200.50]|uniref:UDP-glycosyltransferases domain-containing protein n=1 Tax=Dactylellina haptotyla (strain CBS 200.50) TaxID=1284197 RepID=S8CBM8_DACHA|nr:hypothetical protein H072_900 [Dactylellina haptotyla CBS 200.50]
MTTQRPSIIFLTHPELGQANVHLATLYELLLSRQYDLHIASFQDINLDKSLKFIVDFANENADATASVDTPDGVDDKEDVKRHTVTGVSMQIIHPDPRTQAHSPRFKKFRKHFKPTFDELLNHQNPDEYADSVQSVVDIIKDVRPSVAVVDSLFWQGIDAVRLTKQPYVVLWPNFLKECAGGMMPKLSTAWKLPVSGTGYSYPVPLHLKPANMLIFLSFFSAILTSSKRKLMDKRRKAMGLKGPHPILDLEGAPQITPCLPDIDYPCKFDEEVVTNCGPIIFPSSIEAGDPLLLWIKQAPTVLINLGTHCNFPEKHAVEVLKGIQTVTEKIPVVQILWKWKEVERHAELVEKHIGKDNNRVKIVKWLENSPMDLLNTGDIVCNVHHGGANSFYEALWAGVPHVILPKWFDNYDMAARAEWLGVGVWASRRTAPDENAEELVAGILAVLEDTPRAAKIKESCSKYARISQASGGRKQAADKIGDYARLYDGRDSKETL